MFLVKNDYCHLYCTRTLLRHTGELSAYIIVLNLFFLLLGISQSFDTKSYQVYQPKKRKTRFMFNYSQKIFNCYAI